MLNCRKRKRLKKGYNVVDIFISLCYNILRNKRNNYMNSVTLNVPHFSKVKWHNEDLTYIIGENGVGKTLLMNEMMAWCDSKDYAYAHYYAPSALSEANDLIDNSDDVNHQRTAFF